MRAMMRFLDDNHLPSGQIVAVAGKVEILVPPEDAHGFERACTERLTTGTFTRGADVGAVSLVGQGILDDRRVLTQALDLLEESGVVVDGVTTSSFRITFLMEPARVQDAARALHARFVVREREDAA